MAKLHTKIWGLVEDDDDGILFFSMFLSAPSSERKKSIRILGVFCFRSCSFVIGRINIFNRKIIFNLSSFCSWQLKLFSENVDATAGILGNAIFEASTQRFRVNIKANHIGIDSNI